MIVLADKLRPQNEYSGYVWDQEHKDFENKRTVKQYIFR